MFWNFKFLSLLKWEREKKRFRKVPMTTCRKCHHLLILHTNNTQQLLKLFFVLINSQNFHFLWTTFTIWSWKTKYWMINCYFCFLNVLMNFSYFEFERFEFFKRKIIQIPCKKFEILFHFATFLFHNSFHFFHQSGNFFILDQFNNNTTSQYSYQMKKIQVLYLRIQQ